MPILDAFGRPMTPVAPAKLLERQAVASLGSVRQVLSGHPADGLTPPRVTALLRAAEAGDAVAYLELAEQMEEKDLHYSAVLGVRKRGIRALALQVDPGDDSPAAAEAAEMVRKTLEAAPVKTALIDMMDALGKGFSVSEILWERRGREMAVAGVEWVDPRWFEFDQENGRHILLRDNDGPQPLMPDKYIVHVAKAKSGLAIRGGLARLAAWAYMFKNFNLKDWAIFAEAYGHPLRLGRYDENATAEDRATLLRAVRQIGVDMAAIVPRSMEVEIVSAAGGGVDKLYEGAARWWDEQISKGVLGQVATTDAIAGGHAVGKIHEEVRSDIRDADAEQLAGTLQRDLAGPLTRLNFGAGVAVPDIGFVPPERADPELLLRLLEHAPALGLKIATADVRRAFALREPEEGEDVLQMRQTPAQDPGAPQTRQMASRQDAAAATDSIDALVGRLAEDGTLQDLAEADLSSLIEALEGAADFEEVGDILDAFGAAPAAPALQEHLTRATFAARMAGALGAKVAD
ncbi:Mu-like prophage FluMu protein gp29 [Rhodovulum sp. P5]|uniref:portal protein n=1 Tax=Rhodovulum phage vB_RhkS_P1 TaxID=1873452 RepID=UPI00080AB341|nr:DUF935 domain-containing protein [Rhodovulum sp. P5]YP_009285919.1 portal protein [Rhodovulum phage vB_RhkS_P1]ANT39905.1 hypothetical protein Rhks_34 [Rhodovulum phage vB_RhkS_P1]ARE38973.1 Mu-like prophage FluMu protein gp29 [Rhodovulum sp. P5]